MEIEEKEKFRKRIIALNYNIFITNCLQKLVTI